MAEQDTSQEPRKRRASAAEILAMGAEVAALPIRDPRPIDELREFVSTRNDSLSRQSAE